MDKVEFWRFSSLLSALVWKANVTELTLLRKYVELGDDDL